jgi:gliding motility-associated-like protein
LPLRKLPLLLFVICCRFAFAQGPVIYNETFNAGNGGWIIGGYQPSWHYGIPSLINIASNGTSCFATGDAGAAVNEPYSSCMPAPVPTATGNYYNCCERSYVESPVINLTGVFSPLLKIDINVHCEQTYDGAKMQLSVNGGSSWQDIGSSSLTSYQTFPSSLNCREINWYNKNSVNYLGNNGAGCNSVNYSFGGAPSGWSGGCAQNSAGGCLNPDNHGTNGWITASHCIAAAANKPAVKLRVVFGAGSQVYSDGVAFDNVRIIDASPLVNFSSSPLPGCDPSVLFNNTTDCGESWNWDFGHAGQGSTSLLEHPSHIFPSPGIYTVTLTAKDYCGGTADTAINVTVNPGNAPIVANIENTAHGLCTSKIDTIKIFLSGAGSSPYGISYNLENNTVTLNGLSGNPILITGLEPGVYQNFEITDAAGCTTSILQDVEIPFNKDTLQLEISPDTTIDAGTQVKLIVSSNIPSTYFWTPIESLDNQNSSQPLASPLNSTIYTVSAIDSNGCTVSEEVIVTVEDKVKCNQYFVPNSFTPNGDNKNDVFTISVNPQMMLQSYKMAVYNRWGEVVFTTANSSSFWDGKDAAQGIYMVEADFRCRNKSHSTYSGTLNLIR